MTSNKIDILLAKYWECETSVQEERELQEYFLSESIAERHQQYKPLFSYLESVQEMGLDCDFESKIMEKIAEIGGSDKEKKYLEIRIFEPLLKIAASIAVIAAIGISVFLIEKQNKQVFAETYNDPSVAIKQATSALEKLGEALKQSEQASMRGIRELQEFDLDWSMIDSLAVSADSIPETTDNVDIRERL